MKNVIPVLMLVLVLLSCQKKKEDGIRAIEDTVTSDINDTSYYNSDYSEVSGGPFHAVESDGKWLLYDSADSLITSGQINYLPGPVKVNGKWGILNEMGVQIAAFKYDSIWDWSVSYEFEEGWLRNFELYSYVVIINDKWGIVSSEGREIVPLKYDRIFGISSEGVGCVKRGGKWGYLNTISGKEIITLKYDTVIANHHSSLAGVRLNGKWGFVDWSGNTVIPFRYDFVNFFGDEWASAKKNGKWGFIDMKGNEVIPFQYDAFGELESILGVFEKNLIRAKKNGMWGIIDKKGMEIIPFQYDHIGELGDNLISVVKNGKWGFIDKKNKTKIPFKYDNVGHSFEGAGGQWVFSVSINGKWGTINEKGMVVTPLNFKQNEVEPEEDY